MRAELAGLKLAAAGFSTRLEALPEDRRGASGAERVSFEVKTNPGLPPGPLSAIASGGELSRFMLALCVVLANSRADGALIFDEIDAGIGGAVADAVGRRLARLAETRQVLVVTHQP
jgi:DNA repair protein RecN (Recombination protein N)